MKPLKEPTVGLTVLHHPTGTVGEIKAYFKPGEYPAIRHAAIELTTGDVLVFVPEREDFAILEDADRRAYGKARAHTLMLLDKLNTEGDVAAVGPTFSALFTAACQNALCDAITGRR